MDQNHPEVPSDPGGESGGMTDWENSESFCPEKEQGSCTATEDATTNGSWSQRSISRSLQRAESLLRSTFNPGLRWLFHGCSQDEDQDEGHFVAAHNLVSRSSARLLRLQQSVLTAAPHWQLVGGTQAGSPQVCVKGLPAEGGVHLLPPSCSALRGHYRALRRLLEERSLLLLLHEYGRRARLATAFVRRVSRLLEEQEENLHLHQNPSSWSWLRVGLGPLSQELRVHLNHWSCLVSKVQSDPLLRPALVQQTRLLSEIKRTLDSLALQALVLMERCVRVVLSAVARTDLRSVPRRVLEDVLAGADLYNQAVEEQRAQHGAAQRRTVVLRRAHYSARNSAFPKSRERHPAALSVRELTVSLAAHHAKMAAAQLQHWASAQSRQACPVHDCHESGTGSVHPGCGTREPILQHPLPHHIPDLHLDCTASDNHKPVSSRTDKDQTSRCQNRISQTVGVQTRAEASEPNVENCNLLQNPPLSAVCQQNLSSAEFFFQVLVSSSDLLAPLVSRTPTPEQLPPNSATDLLRTAGSADVNGLGSKPDKDQNTEEAQLEWTTLEIPTRLESAGSSGRQRDAHAETERDCARWPHSVQWLDLGQPPVFADLFGRYRALLRTLCAEALWLQTLTSPDGNLRDHRWGVKILSRVRRAGGTGLVPEECGAALEDFFLRLSVGAARAQWDDALCRSLGSALRDKCVSAAPSSQRDGGAAMSATAQHFLRLAPPLLSALHCHRSDSGASGSLAPPSRSLSLQRRTVSLASAAAQLSSVWIVSKAYQFLSSWALGKFLLITQRDLKVLSECLETVARQATSLLTDWESDLRSPPHAHGRLLLRQQVEALGGAVAGLQTFSSAVLKTFSSDCKRVSGDVFEEAMPSPVHWRTSHRTGFPSSPSEYVSVAAKTVIGQVLEGVAPLSDDARVQTLSVTVTAFLEAWMEHILKQKIKFSVQGALQLKRDFDSIRELIQSDRYGLSAELHQRLLSLRVFQQVDSAVMCLLQQPQVKPLLQPRSWEPFTRCCPASGSDAAVGSSITNLGCVEGEDPTRSDPSVGTTELPPVDPSIPGEPYLAPSLALGAAQQEWLDLRIHGSARRWRLPGLRCLSKSEP